VETNAPDSDNGRRDMTAIRAGVVGVGHLGYHHARNYAAMEGVDLVGITDMDAGRGEMVASEFNTRFFPTVEALLAAGVDAVSVVVPTTSHRAVTCALLEGGVDVLVEKPIATTVEEARDMIRIAAANNRLLQVGHIERFNAAFIALAKTLGDPKFIECHRMSPFPMRSTDVSVVLDLMIHDLDICLALVRKPVIAVDAVGVPIFSTSEDIANVRLRFEGGAVANLTASRISIEKMRKIRIFELNAYVSTNYSEQEVLVYRKQPGALAPGKNPMEMISIEPLSIQYEEPLKLELASFVECVRTRQRPVVAGEEGLAALELAWRIMNAIHEDPGVSSVLPQLPVT
jgi:predicted dehydrogenase